MNIVKLSSRYIDEVVEVHMRSFPNFFLTFLGRRFLKCFYQSFIEDEEGIGFVAIENGSVSGVIVGPLVPDGYFKRLLVRRWYIFALSSFTAVLKNPKIIFRLVRAVFYRGDAPENNNTLSLLSSIAVSPDTQGKGVGAGLLNRFLQDAEQRGSEGCYLTTDREGNESVNRFYLKNGWLLDKRFETPEGRKMNRYVYYFGRSYE
ncbi:ribosomal-protein-alanine acetyltransferase [Sedimentisphaera cyanobacteriorum]|uniref:Ribosomal-protein-alanine acetyltransferase n=1 Tax=Sedimentisphaera cyanobacteriorum TaxID=1940790 RepID=A0A1Q2HP64_9BACT|nr:GNAT family N-acetyltransferase [Sedimentisphaera cyanobacteriorum]AQQ09150.1 ribosomal-protein-alanine acetyltransferase [Sedimentisphaera cyanobacteriorum]